MEEGGEGNGGGRCGAGCDECPCDLYELEVHLESRAGLGCLFGETESEVCWGVCLVKLNQKCVEKELMTSGIDESGLVE